MRVLVATDSFPPNCGGSGWSTWELARGLRARGHALTIVQPRPGQAASGRREYDGFMVDEFAAPAPGMPFLRNYYKNERLYAALDAHLAAVVRRERIDLVHAQHVLTVPAAVAAVRDSGTPVVATVRDYWPVCYWSTLIVEPGRDALCPECSTAGMRACLAGRAGAAWPFALPLIPYMQGNLSRKQAALAGADAIVAVSRQIARDLVARAPALAARRLEVVPNPFDLDGLRAVAAAQPRPIDGPYALYVGKLEANKGADLLAQVASEAHLPMPLVLVGDGRLRGAIEREAAGRTVDLRCTGWLSRDDVLGWMASATMLVFPSRGPESLSRVLIEAGALGVPIAAMETGGTRDIVEPDRTGLLSASADGLTKDVARLAADPELRTRLGTAARAHVDEHFDAARVVARIESLYADLVHGAHGETRG